MLPLFVLRSSSSFKYKNDVFPILCAATLIVVTGFTSILLVLSAASFIGFNSGWQATATNRSGVWSVNGKERNCFFILYYYYLQATNDFSQNICLSWGLKLNIWFNVSEIMFLCFLSFLNTSSIYLDIRQHISTCSIVSASVHVSHNPDWYFPIENNYLFKPILTISTAIRSCKEVMSFGPWAFPVSWRAHSKHESHGERLVFQMDQAGPPPHAQRYTDRLRVCVCVRALQMCVCVLEAGIFSGIPRDGKQNRYELRDWDGRGKYLIGSGRDRE